jgi:FdhE protein
MPPVPDGEASQRHQRRPLQAETCDDCGHYLKIMHTDRDPFVEPGRRRPGQP